MVSVVIPVYNAEEYLNRCMESVVNQSYKNLEIILVDDGSADNSPRMCDEWKAKDNRINVVHKQNAGAGMARNTGLEIATGTYITFVDSDDYIDLSTVERCVSVLMKDGSQLAMFGRIVAHADGTLEPKLINTDKCCFCGEDVVNVILPGLLVSERGYGVGVCGKMFALKSINECGVKFRSEREILSEDTVFLLELFPYLDSVSLLEENLYFYFQNENSLSRTIKKEYRSLNDRFVEFGTALCEKFGYPDRVKNNLKARYQVYALSGMKQTVTADIPQKEKNAIIKSFIENKMLQSTITNEVLAVCSTKLKLFWIFAKFRCVTVCKIMLKFKTKK